jgi:hypothetical protein
MEENAFRTAWVRAFSSATESASSRTLTETVHSFDESVFSSAQRLEMLLSSPRPLDRHQRLTAPAWAKSPCDASTIASGYPPSADRPSRMGPCD